MNAGFLLDPRLSADTRPVARLDLCEARLMDDARFAWLVLVPQRAGLVEVADLTPSERTLLWHEVDRAGAALQAVATCDKLNLGALGNVVRQLHVHVVARREGDAAWPGPVWGSGAAVPYDPTARDMLVERLREALQSPR
ncbi:MAG: HIT domain-containing protein [Frateuria sp.]|uniref:HIT domain-containing protein n=1 Tax=Frateuria sp. TaxID=2211372 RepID=UPI001826B5DF|nr:HIT domain-containing protein [Frateuria sp.]NUO72925.1 HIT domain-containing protein [Frateuria sp.]NUR21395.1 HIT domain-containing protein [Frateuria sp.]